MALTPVQIRVLGCLIEKRRTTPEAYPLTINALRLACNQSTNRDPVVDYGEPEVREAAAALGRRRLVRLASGQGSRATKYRHVANEALGLGEAELAVMGVLMLRGAQTPGELKARADRLHPFAGLDEVHATLEGLVRRELVAGVGRRPGQKEERYAQLLGGAAEDDTPEEEGSASDAATGSTRPEGPVEADLDPHGEVNLECRVAELEAQVRDLREALGSLRRDLGDPDGEQTREREGRPSA